MRSTHAVIVVAAGLLAAGAPACSNKAPDKDSPPAAATPAGCQKDTDCKGDRVCSGGVCQDAPHGGKPASPAQAPGATQAPASPAQQPASASEFRVVPETEWKPEIGPRLRIGAVVAHQVFEGPFGPAAKSMFVVTREGSDFVATVWADGHGYRSAPLANNGGNASKIPAVAFFDADGDGTTDALVMATYSPKEGGGPDAYDNVLLRWKGTSLLRMPDLEKHISGLESVAAVRAKLKR